jgi:hypothetical protein
MNARDVMGVIIVGLLAGLGFATLFVHFVAGGCIPN